MIRYNHSQLGCDMTLDELNSTDAQGFVAALGDVFEKAPWVAARAAAARPFATVAALHAAMMAAVRSATDVEVVSFLNGHPELAGDAARRGTLDNHSASEHAAAGLVRMDDALVSDFARLNEHYRARFGFPFIVCVRRHTLASIIATFERRSSGDPDGERKTALDEIGFITRLRLAGRVEGPGMPRTDGLLTTHVLDTAAGRPAKGMAVALFELSAGGAVPLIETVTNEGGRTDAPLVSGRPLRIGRYELRFDVGRYFAATQRESPPFLGLVPIQFGVSEPETHYHVPLLVSPGAYSTYRGS